MKDENCVFYTIEEILAIHKAIHQDYVYDNSFYPAEKPEYVITVFALDGESGSKTCAPVFKEICDYIN